MTRQQGNVAKSKCIDRAVRRLVSNGMEIRATRIGNIRPVIEIERPDSLCCGYTITTRYGHQRATLNVAPLEGCLVTWRA